MSLPDQAVERYTESAGDGYRLTAQVRRGERLESVALPTLVFPVDAVLS